MRVLILLCLVVASSAFYQFGLECITCQATVKAAEDKAEKEGEELTAPVIASLCKDVSPTHAAEKYCEKYGDHEVEVILDGIIAKESPKAICEKLGKC